MHGTRDMKSTRGTRAHDVRKNVKCKLHKASDHIRDKVRETQKHAGHEACEAWGT